MILSALVDYSKKSDLLSSTPRMRLYPAEKVIACAKPLRFLPCDLKLKKDGCQRLI